MQPSSAVESLLKGNVLGNGCPFHPAIVHLPVALYVISAIMMLVSWAGFGGTNTSLLMLGSYWANIGAIIMTIPAALTGLAEYRNMKADNQPALDTVHRHIACNVIVLGLSIWLWWIANPSAPPTNLRAILSLMILILISYSGHQGGRLAYEYGVGVQRQGYGLEAKSKLPNPNTPLI